MAKQTTILFVLGAWHTEFHANPITPILTSCGYNVVPIRLATTSTNRTPPPNFEDTSSQIQSHIRSALSANQRVILIGHSAAGIPCAHAAGEFLSTATPDEMENFSLIFIAAFWNLERALTAPDWFHIDFQTMVAKVTEKMLVAFYNDMPEDEGRVFWKELVDSSVAPPPVVKKGWEERTLAYVVCLQDGAFAVERQRLEVEENGLKMVDFDGGHCPFISKPEEFAKVVDGIIRG